MLTYSIATRCITKGGQCTADDGLLVPKVPCSIRDSIGLHPHRAFGSGSYAVARNVEAASSSQSSRTASLCATLPALRSLVSVPLFCVLARVAVFQLSLSY